MRSASCVTQIALSLFAPSLASPSWYSGRLWLQRLGYYKLNRPKQKADDWAWIIDHTIQSGEEKCLLVLGVRLGQLSHTGMVLDHKDVEPIALYPVKQSNGEVVFQQLEEAIEKTGIPREIISDKGSDLNAGIRMLRKKHPQISGIYDIKHKTAALLKRVLNNDDQWKLFIHQAAKCKSQTQQTALAFIAPPGQRSKSRYMNLECLVRWSQRALVVLDKLEKRTEKVNSHRKLEAKLGWLREYRDDIAEWQGLLDVTITTECFVRDNGLWRGSEKDLAKQMKSTLVDNTQHPRVVQLKKDLLSFVKNESLKAQNNETLLGSSEVIESVFGKQKRLENNQAKSGITSSILNVAAIVAENTQEVVHKAMESVSTKNIIDWTKANIGQTVQSKRKTFCSIAGKTEQIWDQFIASI